MNTYYSETQVYSCIASLSVLYLHDYLTYRVITLYPTHSQQVWPSLQLTPAKLLEIIESSLPREAGMLIILDVCF